MTVSELERDVLSLRTWLTRTVLPTAVVLAVVLALLAAGGGGEARLGTQSPLDHKAVIVGFFALYYVLVRGGHLVMVRSLHAELKKKYPDAYAERLAELPSLRGRNAGFALARLKRGMIDDGVVPNANRLDEPPNTR